MVEQGSSPCGISKHNLRLYLQATNFLLLGSTLQSFHGLPIAHPLINPSMNRSTDVRILTIQHLSERSPLLGDDALDLLETVHMQTMANMTHCKGEKTYRCSKRKLQFTIYFLIKAITLPDQESLPLCKKLSLPVSTKVHFSHSPPD